MKILRGDIEASINWQGGKKASSFYANYDKIDWSAGRENPSLVKVTVRKGKAQSYYSTLMLEVKEAVTEARKPPHLKKNLVG